MDKAKQIPDDDTMNVIMNTVYNQWFMRYKDRRITTDDRHVYVTSSMLGREEPLRSAG